MRQVIEQQEQHRRHLAAMRDTLADPPGALHRPFPLQVLRAGIEQLLDALRGAFQVTLQADSLLVPDEALFGSGSRTIERHAAGW